MTISNNPSEIIKRIQSGNWNDSDLESLRELLQSNDNETLQQLGKFNISIDEGREIQIGDRNYFNWSDEAIQAVLEVVQAGKAVTVFNPTGKVTIYNYNNYYREETRTVPVDKTEETDNLPCPYRGLFSFSPEDAEYFFGREVFIEELYQATQTRNFIPVLGASGSGKSSVVFAGLVPKLQQESDWQFTYFRPGFIRKKDKKSIPDPFYALATALVPLYTPELNTTQQLKQKNELANFLRSGDVLLSDVISEIRDNYPNFRLLLIADQFEEIYTICEDEKIRRQFIDILIDNIYTPTSNSPLVLVLTMRADFLGNALSYHSFAEVLNSDIKLGGMNPTELREVIEKPADILGVEFEPGLVEAILNDVEDAPGNLPLLEFALTELWKRRKGKQITHAAYQKIGKVQGALTRHADRVFSQLSPEEKQQAKRIFIQLVNLGDSTEGTKDTRRRVTKSDLGELNWNLVTKLAGQNCRLVVTSQNANQQETVEVVHEALIRDWLQMRDWVNESRNIIRTGQKIESKAQEWEDQGRKKDYLLQGKQLLEATKFKQEKAEQFTLSSLANEFIQVSINSGWRNRLMLASVLVVPLVFLFMIVYPPSRKSRITQAHDIIKNGSVREKPTEVYYLASGCKWPSILHNSISFLFGNCESLLNADLKGADLRGFNLSYADLRGVNLFKANLRYAQLFEADFSNAYLKGINLSYANLRYAKLRADLSYAYLRGINLSYADLIRANFRGADLSYADLRGVNLFKADLSRANLSYADFTSIRYAGPVRNLTPEQVKSACYWQEAKFDPEFLEQLKASPDPEEKPDCSIWEDESS